MKSEGYKLLLEIQRLLELDARRIKKVPQDLWKLGSNETRDSIPMADLKRIIESERRGQIEMNSPSDPEVHQALSALESVWEIANGNADEFPSENDDQ